MFIQNTLNAITMMMVLVYAKMGYNDKAKALASKQNSISEYYNLPEWQLPEPKAFTGVKKYIAEVVEPLIGKHNFGGLRLFD